MTGSDTERSGDPVPRRTLDWVERETGARVGSVVALQVASISMHLVEVRTPAGAGETFALRRYTDAERLGDDPWFVPENEARTMELLAPTAVPTPVLIAADPGGVECDVPALLTTRLPGGPPTDVGDYEDFARQLAERLLTIHEVATKARPEGLPSYLRYTEAGDLAVPDRPEATAAWERAIEIVSEPEPGTAHIFIHRDYHQWNTLWERGNLTGVVDWNSAAWGPPAIDIGRMRQNLAWDYNADVAEDFLRQYEALGGPGTEDRVYWELVDCADSLPFGPPGEDDPVKERRLDEWVALLVAQYS